MGYADPTDSACAFLIATPDRRLNQPALDFFRLI